MSEAILVNALEQLVPFLNEKNVLELVVRGNNKRIKAFQKVALDGLAHGEEQALVNKAIHALNANTGMAQRSLQLVQDVTKMQQLGLVLNGLNLCATCAGFAVMYAKLDSMSTEINRQFLQLQNMMKQGHDLQASYEFDKVLSEHTNMIKILFVCHGNICRSPMAEYILKDMAVRAGVADRFEIDSAAVSREEIGNPVYPAARRELGRHGVFCGDHTARQVTAADLRHFDRIYYMDSSNARLLRRLLPDDPEKIRPLLDRDVADPWYTGDFGKTWDDLVEGCTQIMEEFG